MSRQEALAYIDELKLPDGFERSEDIERGPWERCFVKHKDSGVVIITVSALGAYNSGYVNVRGQGCDIKTYAHRTQEAFDHVYAWSMSE